MVPEAAGWLAYSEIKEIPCTSNGCKDLVHCWERFGVPSNWAVEFRSMLDDNGVVSSEARRIDEYVKAVYAGAGHDPARVNLLYTQSLLVGDERRNILVSETSRRLGFRERGYIRALNLETNVEQIELNAWTRGKSYSVFSTFRCSFDCRSNIT